MKKILGMIVGGMTIVALIYLNMRAVQATKPFFQRVFEKLGGSWFIAKTSSAYDRVRSANGVQAIKRGATKIKDKGAHIFRRNEASENSQSSKAA